MKKNSLYFITAVLICYSCVSLKKGSDTFKTNYSIRYAAKINDSVIREEFNLYITHQSKYRIYEFPYHKTFEDNFELVYDSLKYEYFVCDSTKNYGYSFQDFFDSTGLKLNRDSLLKAKGLIGHEAQIKDESKIVSESEVIVNNDVIHKYYIADTLTDSCYLYFNTNMMDAHFSFSPILDATYSSKLYKVVYFYKKGIFSPKEDTSKFDGVIMEIKKVPISNLNEMKILMNKVATIESSNK